MAVRICVRVSGLDSADAPDELRADLAEHTKLTWNVEPPAGSGKTLGGIGTIVLTAVITASSEMLVKYAVEESKKVLRRLKSEYVDPPEATVETQPVVDPETDED